MRVATFGDLNSVLFLGPAYVAEVVFILPSCADLRLHANARGRLELQVDEAALERLPRAALKPLDIRGRWCD